MPSSLSDQCLLTKQSEMARLHPLLAYADLLSCCLHLHAYFAYLTYTFQGSNSLPLLNECCHVYRNYSKFFAMQLSHVNYFTGRGAQHP